MREYRFLGHAKHSSLQDTPWAMATEIRVECILGSKCIGWILVRIDWNGNAEIWTWLQVTMFALLTSRWHRQHTICHVLWLLARCPSRYDWTISSTTQSCGTFCGSWRIGYQLCSQRRVLGSWFFTGRNAFSRTFEGRWSYEAFGSSLGWCWKPEVATSFRQRISQTCFQHDFRQRKLFQAATSASTVKVWE